MGKEVVLRLKTDLKTKGIWETDSNGYFMMERIRNSRKSYNYSQIEGLEYESSNYYPVATTVTLMDFEKQPLSIGGQRRSLSLLVDRPVGISSLIDGELEIMLHRL